MCNVQKLRVSNEIGVNKGPGLLYGHDLHVLTGLTFIRPHIWFNSLLSPLEIIDNFMFEFVF